MFALQHIPIKAKLIAMMMITASIGIVIMATAIVVNEAQTKRETIVTELTTLAEVIGSRSTGSLTFNDPRTATENLSALQINKNVIYAEILDENNQVFAEYYPGFSYFPPPHDEELKLLNLFREWFPQLYRETIEVSIPIILDEQIIGTTRIISSLDAFYRNLIHYLGWIGIISVLCFLLSLIVSTSLHRLISKPIVQLNQAAKKVSVDNNYAIRLTAERDDELGLLINNFNTMLEQIEARDHQLEQHSHELEIQVQKRSSELLRVNQVRIQWLENMAKFLKHELKNATVGMNTSLDLIERRAAEAPIEKYLQRARKSIGFMRVLLDSVSHASSLEAAVHKEALTSLNLSRLIKDEIADYRVFYPQYQLVDECQDNIDILGNEDRIKQLLDKLVGNAFEHCKQDTPIQIGLSRNTENVMLTVSNEGVKLPEDKTRIFDLFVSLRDAVHWKSDSLGLGLYIVKLIAVSHKGTVTAEDRQDTDGARFTVTFPVLESSSTNEALETDAMNSGY